MTGKPLPRWTRRVLLSFGYIVLLALAAGGLLFATWPVVGATLVLLALTFAIAATAVAGFDGSRRAFALGFLIGGLSYYALATLLDDDLYTPLATTALLVEAHAHVVRELPNPNAAPAGGVFPAGGFGSGFPTTPTIPIPYRQNFVAVGECLWSLAFGLFGGWVANRYPSKWPKSAS